MFTDTHYPLIVFKKKRAGTIISRVKERFEKCNFIILLQAIFVCEKIYGMFFCRSLLFNRCSASNNNLHHFFFFLSLAFGAVFSFFFLFYAEHRYLDTKPLKNMNSILRQLCIQPKRICFLFIYSIFSVHFFWAIFFVSWSFEYPIDARMSNEWMQKLRFAIMWSSECHWNGTNEEWKDQKNERDRYNKNWSINRMQ